MAAWYIARARFDRASQIAEAIAEELGYATLCPVDQQNGFDRYHKKRVKLVPVFGPYFFFQADMTDYVWHEISGWPHVAEIMGGEKPWPVIDEEIVFWRKHTDDRGIVTDADLIEKIRKFGKFIISVGDKVRLIEPPHYEGRIGTCVWIDQKKIRLGVEIEGLLGRNTVIPVLAAWCKKIEDRPETPPVQRRRKGVGGLYRTLRSAKLRARAQSK